MSQKAATPPINGQRWIPISNGSGEAIPAYGAVELSWNEGSGEFTTQKPTADPSKSLAFASSIRIPAGKPGLDTVDLPTWAIGKPGDDINAGVPLGVVAGQWHLGIQGSGLQAMSGFSSLTIMIGWARQITLRKGATASVVSPGGTVDVDVGGGESIQATDPNLLALGETIAAGTQVVIAPGVGEWWIISARCPPP